MLERFGDVPFWMHAAYGGPGEEAGIEDRSFSPNPPFLFPFATATSYLQLMGMSREK